MAGKLTDKQKIFVQEYLVDLNATQAAIRAGYSPKNAEQLAYQLLQKTTVSEALQKAMKRRAARTEISQDMVLRELAAVGFASASDFAVVRNGSVVIRDTSEVDREKLPAVAGYKESKYGLEVKLHDKIRALELIGRHIGMFSGKDSDGDALDRLDAILRAVQDEAQQQAE